MLFIHINQEGVNTKKTKKLLKNLCLDITKYTNTTLKSGLLDMPVLYCTSISPDFLSLSRESNLYFATNKTAICFYEYDLIFDGINGLYSAIYYNRADLLSKWKKKFSGVKIFISPDYSLLEDTDFVENLYRIYKSRVVSIWLATELRAIVIPNISFCDIKTCDVALAGLEQCSTVAISTKGHMNSEEERIRLKRLVNLQLIN